MTALDVSGNDIGDGGKSTIGDALLSSSTSKLQFLACTEWSIKADTSSLNLRGKRLNAADAKLLAGVIKFNRALTSVNLLKNDLGGGAAGVVAAAKQHGKIKTLCGIEEGKDKVSFFDNGLKAPDAVLLSFDLEFNRALNSVDLRANSIPDEGKQQLRNAVREKSITLQL